MVEIKQVNPIQEFEFTQAFFVAEDNGELVASVMGHIVDENTLVIDLIQTNPPFRRNGIGTLLLSTLIEWGKKQGAQLVGGEFRPDALIRIEDAKRWYEKRGFEIVDENLKGRIK